MTHRITRSHEIDAGHRVCGHTGKCMHLHGHRYRIAFTCEADQLDALGMVVDFGVLKTRLCFWLEENWDHRLLLWAHDPMLPALKDLDPEGVRSLPLNPTAENLALLLVRDVGPAVLADTGVRLIEVTVHETAKCSATYSRSLELPNPFFDMR